MEAGVDDILHKLEYPGTDRYKICNSTYKSAKVDSACVLLVQIRLQKIF